MSDAIYDQLESLVQEPGVSSSRDFGHITCTVEGKPFEILRIVEHGAERLVIDGVKCAPEVLKIIMNPDPRYVIWGERRTGVVTYHREVR